MHGMGLGVRSTARSGGRVCASDHLVCWHGVFDYVVTSGIRQERARAAEEAAVQKARVAAAREISKARDMAAMLRQQRKFMDAEELAKAEQVPGRLCSSVSLYQTRMMSASLSPPLSPRVPLCLFLYLFLCIFLCLFLSHS